MGARYERAYHSYRESLALVRLLSYVKDQRVPMTRAAGSSASTEAQGAVRASGGKRGKRRATIVKVDK